MKEFKGTPGPWEWDFDNDCIISDISELCVMQLVVTGDTTESEDEANTELLVASPLLLSALQSLVEKFDDPSGKQWTTTSKREALANARAAIDKALGE